MNQMQMKEQAIMKPAFCSIPTLPSSSSSAASTSISPRSRSHTNRNAVVCRSQRQQQQQQQNTSLSSTPNSSSSSSPSSASLAHAFTAATASLAVLIARMVVSPSAARAEQIPFPSTPHPQTHVSTAASNSTDDSRSTSSPTRTRRILSPSTVVIRVKAPVEKHLPSEPSLLPTAAENLPIDVTATASSIVAEDKNSASQTASTPIPTHPTTVASTAGEPNSTTLPTAKPSTSSSSTQATCVATQTAPPTLSVQAVPSSNTSLPPKLSELSAAASLSAFRNSIPSTLEMELPPVASSVLSRVRASRVRPAAIGLMGVGAVTSTHFMVSQLARRFGRSRGEGRWSQDAEHRAIITRELHNACTVVCMRIPFCVSDRSQLLRELQNLIKTQRCNDAAAMAAACRAVADVVRSQDGLLEDSRRFAPHVDIFVAEGIAEAERRFCGHVSMESMCADRLRRHSTEHAGDSENAGADYGVVTLVVATTEGVDLECYEEEMTNMQRLRAALDSMARLEEGEAAGLEVVWVPGEEGGQPLSKGELADAFPCLEMV